MPGVSPIDVVNIALQQIGQTPITSFDTVVGGGFLTQKFYDQQRQALLRRIPWNFARVFKSLATLTAVPLALALNSDPDTKGAIQYTTAYELPNDFIRLIKFSPYNTHWRIVGAQLLTDAAPVINTSQLIGLQPIGADGSDNQPPTPGTISGGYPIGIEYIFDELSPDNWDSLFTETMIMRMVYLLSFGITGLSQIRDDAKGDYKDNLAEAAYVNGAEQQPETWNDNIVMDVRFGYGTTDLDNL